jgi:hypothetical protein
MQRTDKRRPLIKLRLQSDIVTQEKGGLEESRKAAQEGLKWFALEGNT